MIIDKLCEFADAVALDTSGTGYQLVGSALDSSVARDLGAGQMLYLILQVDTAITGTSSTVQFILASDSSSAIAVDGSATEHYLSDLIPEATLVAGYTMVVPLPSVAPAYEQYLGIIANVGTAVLTAGKINAFLTMDPTGWKAYAEGQN